MCLGRAAAVLGLWLTCRADEEWPDDFEIPEGFEKKEIRLGGGDPDFVRLPGMGPLGTRSVTAPSWDMETVGKQVMVTFLHPDDPRFTGFAPAWRKVAEPHEKAAYTGLYEVDCAESPTLCEMSKRQYAPHIMYGTPTYNLSALTYVHTGLGAEELWKVTEMMGPVCSLKDTIGCSEKDMKKVRELIEKTRKQLETEIHPLREQLAEFFQRRQAWAAEDAALSPDIVTWHRKKKAVRLERAALKDSGLPEAELREKDAELATQEDAFTHEKLSRVRRREELLDNIRPALDAEWKLLDLEVKHSDYSLLRMVIDSKGKADSKSKKKADSKRKKKMSEEL